MIIGPETTSDWVGLGGLATAISASVGWWFHVRRLSRADRVDGSVTSSIGFVLSTLREELERLKLDNMELRSEVNLLKAEALLATAAAKAASLVLSTAATAKGVDVK